MSQNKTPGRGLHELIYTAGVMAMVCMGHCVSLCVHAHTHLEYVNVPWNSYLGMLDSMAFNHLISLWHKSPWGLYTALQHNKHNTTNYRSTHRTTQHIQLITSSVLHPAPPQLPHCYNGEGEGFQPFYGELSFPRIFLKDVPFHLWTSSSLFIGAMGYCRVIISLVALTTCHACIGLHKHNCEDICW